MDDVSFDYAPPRAVAENIWTIDGSWKNKLGRRMTVVRLLDGRLAIHNAIRLRSPELDWLRSLGRPAFIVAPNSFHCSDADWMSVRFPEAALFVPESKLATFSNKGLNPIDLSLHFPAEVANELKCIPIKGTRIEEAAFVHSPSKTLILCDLAFNMPDVFTGLAKHLMKWNGVGGRFGPSRLLRLFFSKDKALLVESYRRLLEENFDRVIVNHGLILESDGKARLRAGVQEIFGPI